MDDNALAIFVFVLAIMFLLVVTLLTIVCLRQQKQIDKIKTQMKQMKWGGIFWKD